MQVNTSEINGFVIDQFNIHSLETGKTQGICPLCSSDRQPKNQKSKCASYDWERVSELVIIAIEHFNYIRTSEKV